MSLILDALRKAERERNIGQPPRLEDVATAPSDGGGEARNPWAWLMLGTALLLIVALLLFLRRGETPPTAAAGPAQVRTTPAPTPALAAPPAATPAPLPVRPPPRVAQARSSSAAVLPVDEGLASFDDLLPPQPAPEPAREIRPREPATANDPPATPPATPAQVAPPNHARIATLRLDPPQTSGVPKVSELPPSLRGDFPQIGFDVHVWNEEPSRRFVLIGGQRFGEGDRLPQGPTIREIVPDGVVFDHRGNAVLLPLNR